MIDATAEELHMFSDLIKRPLKQTHTASIHSLFWIRVFKTIWPTSQQ